MYRKEIVTARVMDHMHVHTCKVGSLICSFLVKRRVSSNLVCEWPLKEKMAHHILNLATGCYTWWWLSKRMLITWCGEIYVAQIWKSKLTVILKSTKSCPGLRIALYFQSQLGYTQEKKFSSSHNWEVQTHLSWICILESGPGEEVGE